MLAEFLEIDAEGKKETVYIRPDDIVKVKKGRATDPEKQVFTTQLIHANGKSTLVEGTPSDTRQKLQNPR